MAPKGKSKTPVKEPTCKDFQAVLSKYWTKTVKRYSELMVKCEAEGLIIYDEVSSFLKHNCEYYDYDSLFISDQALLSFYLIVSVAVKASLIHKNVLVPSNRSRFTLEEVEAVTYGMNRNSLYEIISDNEKDDEWMLFHNLLAIFGYSPKEVLCQIQAHTQNATCGLLIMCSAYTLPAQMLRVMASRYVDLQTQAVEAREDKRHYIYQLFEILAETAVVYPSEMSSSAMALSTRLVRQHLHTDVVIKDFKSRHFDNTPFDEDMAKSINFNGPIELKFVSIPAANQPPPLNKSDLKGASSFLSNAQDETSDDPDMIVPGTSNQGATKTGGAHELTDAELDKMCDDMANYVQKEDSFSESEKEPQNTELPSKVPSHGPKRAPPNLMTLFYLTDPGPQVSALHVLKQDFVVSAIENYDDVEGIRQFISTNDTITRFRIIEDIAFRAFERRYVVSRSLNNPELSDGADKKGAKKAPVLSDRSLLELINQKLEGFPQITDCLTTLRSLMERFNSMGYTTPKVPHVVTLPSTISTFSCPQPSSSAQFRAPPADSNKGLPALNPNLKF